MRLCCLVAARLLGEAAYPIMSSIIRARSALKGREVARRAPERSVVVGIRLLTLKMRRSSLPVVGSMMTYFRVVPIPGSFPRGDESKSHG